MLTVWAGLVLLLAPATAALVARWIDYRRQQ